MMSIDFWDPLFFVRRRQSQMRSAIYGAGSLGTVLGAYITKNGGQIDLINRNRAHVEALREHGARITGTVEEQVPVTALTPEEMTGTYDIILLLTKQLYNAEVVAMLRDYLAEDGVIVTLQNGLPEPGIAEIVGAHRTMGCVVEWGATLSAPGVCTLTSSPDSLSFHMGRMEGISDGQYNAVKALLEKMCPVHEEPNLLGARWSKLLINATFSGLGTVVGGVFGDVSGDKAARRVAIRCMKECIDVGRAEGITFAPVQGKDITSLFDYKGAVKRTLATLLIPIAMKKHRAIEPSMLQDLKKGKPCEVDAINGVVCAYGRKWGVPTPINDQIVEIIKQCQQGQLKPGQQNIHLFDALL
jgi:2-dehydropantoate 2-reductase